MGDILRDHTVRIEKSMPREAKRNTVLRLVFFVFLLIPFEADFLHWFIIRCHESEGNTTVWLDVWDKKGNGAAPDI